MKPELPRTVHVVPHTHWDREWYEPFETFQARLVDVVEDALHHLEQPGDAYPRFTLDGQAIALQDVLDLRPDLADRIERQVRAGRLRVGPWYVLSDEFLTSPEALVRNLTFGLRIARRFGGAMGVAYTPDSFGHIAHLPTLARGFGLDAIVFERGVGNEGDELGAEFTWVSPDGASAVLGVHLLATYSAATALGHVGWDYRDRFDPARAERHVRALLHAEPGAHVDAPWLQTAIDRLDGGLAAAHPSNHVLLLNGSDHLFAQPSLPEAIASLNERIDHATFVHDDVEGYVRAAIAADHELATYQGEFRWSRYHHVLSGVWSTRMPLKQRNHALETKLERIAEPLHALAAAHGGQRNDGLLDQAWRTLLQNHPHDSICGCSIDPVHEAMQTRFDAVEHLADATIQRAVAQLRSNEEADRHYVFEPSPYGTRGVLELTLDVAEGEGAFATLRDASGAAYPTQRHVQRIPAPGRHDRFVDRTQLLACGRFAPLDLTPVQIDTSGDEAAFAEAHELVTVQATATGLTLDNGRIAITVHADTTLELHDRVRDVRYALDLHLEDQTDVGDEYDFSPCTSAAPRRSSAAGGARLEAAGPVRATIAIDHTLTLPEGVDDAREPLPHETTLHATLRLHLDAAADTVTLDVTGTNPARDHRLRLHVGSDLHGDELVRDTHWAILRRPIDPPASDDWYQQPVRTHPIRRFAALEEHTRALAVATRGLPELEVTRHEDGNALLVTLLRAVGWLSRDDLTSRPQGAGPALETPAAQLPGPFQAQLALVPYAPADPAHRERAIDRFIAPLTALRPVTEPPMSPLLRTQADGGWHLEAPLSLSIVAAPRLDGPLADAAVGTVLVRIVNPTERAVDGALRAPVPLRAATLVRLDQTPLEELATDGPTVHLHLAPYAVHTLALRLDLPARKETPHA